MMEWFQLGGGGGCIGRVSCKGESVAAGGEKIIAREEVVVVREERFARGSECLQEGKR